MCAVLTHQTAIPSPAKDATHANVDTSVVMKPSLNGNRVCQALFQRMLTLRSKNCTKHNVRCPYMDMPPPEDRNPTPERADQMWNPELGNRSPAISNDIQSPMTMMDYSMPMGRQQQNRVSWQQPDRSSPYAPNYMGSPQTFPQFDMAPVYDNNVYTYGNSSQLAYSQEQLTPFTTAQNNSPGISALSMDPFAGAPGQFLGLPSPSFAGYHSPGGSSYGEPSYSDQGNDEYLYDNSLNTGAYGGFVDNTMWMYQGGQGSNIAQDV